MRNESIKAITEFVKAEGFDIGGESIMRIVKDCEDNYPIEREFFNSLEKFKEAYTQELIIIAKLEATDHVNTLIFNTGIGDDNMGFKKYYSIETGDEIVGSYIDGEVEYYGDEELVSTTARKLG